MKDDLTKYREARMKRDPEFAKGYEEGYQEFKIGVLLKAARERAGMTQEEVAKKLRTNKSAISRIENHADRSRLSTLHKYAHALGRKITVAIG